MRKIAESTGHDLQWSQPKALKMEYELQADGSESIATLRFKSPLFGFLATAESADGCWTFNQIGFLKPKTVIRACANDIDLAIFENNEWDGGGVLKLPSGHCYAAVANFFQTQYEFRTESDEPLIRIKARGWFHLSAKVEILQAACLLPELPWMVMLGWYLTIDIASPGEFAFRRIAGYLGLGN